MHALKRAGVETAEAKIEEFPAFNAYEYRNRIQLHGNPKDRTVGFYASRKREIVPIRSCPIARPEINQAIPELAELGFARFTEPFKLEIEVTPEGKIRHAFNERHAAFGFRQVNDDQNLSLKRFIKDNLNKSELLLDLYGGSGNLSIPFVNDFSEIYCVDTFIDSARPAPHFHFEKKDVLAWAKQVEKPSFYKKSTSVILDPPREGIGASFAAIEAKISKFDVKCLILVGCDVDSFVRDTKQFTNRGYRLAKIGVLDLFPQTPHVESLALFFK